MQKYTLYNGDCLEYMKKIKTSSVAFIVADPHIIQKNFENNNIIWEEVLQERFYEVCIN